MNKIKYDLLVVGGGTSGCACAYTAAKLGLKVLLVEKESFLGGSITSSLVIPAMKTSDNAINTNFYNELYNRLNAVNGAITYSDGNIGWFNPELTKIILDQMLLEAGVKICFEAHISYLKKELSSYTATIQCNNISCFASNMLLLSIETNNVVDATGDGKICTKLNYKKIDFKNKTQPVNLRFILSGININKFNNWLLEYDKDRNVTTSCIINSEIYLSTAYTWDTSVQWALKPLFTNAIAKGIINETDSNYFQIFSVAGTPDSIAFNCPRILDNIDNTSAYIEGRASILRLLNFCKLYLPGFEKAYISNIANKLGVRVSNCIKGKYVYTLKDLKTGKKFENPVVISNYPIDIHSSKKNNSVLEKMYQEYQLPLESLIVDDNLFVIGRCISCEFEAQAALRIIPSCFSMGEGLAKYLAQKKV